MYQWSESKLTLRHTVIGFIRLLCTPYDLNPSISNTGDALYHIRLHDFDFFYWSILLVCFDQA